MAAAAPSSSLSAVNAASTEGLLVIVVDTNPQFWFSSASSSSSSGGGGGGGGEEDLQHLLESLLVFVNSYLLLHRSNRIVILAAHAGQTEMLFPDPNHFDTSGCTQQSALVHQQVRSQLQKLALHAQQTYQHEQAKHGMGNGTDPSKDHKPTRQRTAISAALSRSLCFINRVMQDHMDLHARILVLQKSPDVSEHYISIMNVIFSAQKKGIPIDSCVLATTPSSFLQQAAYLTGGIHFQPHDHKALLQYLVSIYLADETTRHLLKLPVQDNVDFRAMCFCHKNVISTAFVCPVCLSLFCEFQPVCSTCGIRSRIKPTTKTNQQQQQQQQQHQYHNNTAAAAAASKKRARVG